MSESLDRRVRSMRDAVVGGRGQTKTRLEGHLGRANMHTGHAVAALNAARRDADADAEESDLLELARELRRLAEDRFARVVATSDGEKS